MVEKTLLLSAAAPGRLQVAVLEDGRLAEYSAVPLGPSSLVGNIYLGVIRHIEPSIQSAFVDVGLEKTGFLHVSDVEPFYFGQGSTPHALDSLLPQPAPKRAHTSDKQPPVQDIFTRGQRVLVQVIKERDGKPVVSTYLSLTGRFLFVMPGLGRVGITRQLTDAATRQHLAKVAAKLERPPGAGLIVRASAATQPDEELARDAARLTRLWESVAGLVGQAVAPALVYSESGDVSQVVRDWIDRRVAAVWVDDPAFRERLGDCLGQLSPGCRAAVEHFPGPGSLFQQFGVDAAIEQLARREVPLDPDGVLIIDQSEALVPIAVKATKALGGGSSAGNLDLNLAAAPEIARQIRLRNLGGLIACTFLPLADEKQRQRLNQVLRKALARDRSRPALLPVSKFGLVQVARSRLGQADALEEAESFRPTGSKAPIFISYRQEDSIHQTGRIYDWLEEHFGAEKIFRDVETIPAGVNWRRFLEASIQNCAVMLVPIGDRWLAAFDGREARGDDWVLFELELGLRRNIPIIPLLVASCGVPPARELPKNIQGLAEKHGIPIRPGTDFRQDVRRLIERLEKLGIPRAEE